jgi:hypothetical protein
VNQRINPRNDACQNDTAGEVPPVIGGPDKVAGIGQQVRAGDPRLLRREWVGQELGVRHELVEQGCDLDRVGLEPVEPASVDHGHAFKWAMNSSWSEKNRQHLTHAPPPSLKAHSGWAWGTSVFPAITENGGWSIHFPHTTHALIPESPPAHRPARAAAT